MSLFSKQAIGISWNQQGECFAVLMKKKGDSYHIVDSWQDKTSNQDALPNLLSQGVKQLSKSENDIIIAGESGMNCSFVDVHLPFMNSKDMSKSLEFTLSGHFPIDPADLTWCFRVVNDKVSSGQAHVRLLATKHKHWQDWLDRLGALKVDLIVPPIAVADSVIKTEVHIKSSANQQGFEIFTDENGLQKLRPCNDSSQAFGIGTSPLKMDKLVLGQLSSKSSEAQSQFTDAVILGLHGLECNITKEKETGFKIPKELTPKRNVLTSTLCIALVVYLLSLGVFQAIRHYGAQKQEANHIKKVTDVLQENMEENTVDTELMEKLQQLQEELNLKVYRPPSPKNVLVEITKNLPDEFYLSSFHFRGDKATCKVKTSDAAASSGTLFKTFKAVEYFDEDVQVVDEASGSITLILTVKQLPISSKGEL